MKTRNQNIAHKESRICDLGGANTPSSDAHTARRGLRIVSAILGPEKSAERLGLKAGRTVQKWISGESEIPQKRTQQIAEITKEFYLTELNAVEAEIDRMLLRQYGDTRSM